MSAYCTTCGTRRAETAKFCSHCEAGFEESRPTRATEAPPGHEESWFVGATVILAVVVVLGILGANALIADALAVPGSADISDSRSSGDRVGPDGFITPESVDPATEGAPTETWSPTPTEYETTEPPPEPTPTPEPTLGNDLVAVAPEAALDPAAAAVVQLLTAHFAAINAHDYAGYQATHTRAARAKLTSKQFTAGYRSTVNSDITVLGLSTATDGRRLAEVSFTSNQNAADGPEGQTCTHWTVGKFLEGQGTTLLIGKAPTSYKSRHEAC